MKVWFEASNGKRRLIGEASTYQEANSAITGFLNDRNYKPYYWRITPHDNEIEIDVGSWCEFFWITEVDPDAVLKEMKQ